MPIPAVNYAETGATTIGHEMGHGFDDEGRQFDAKGRLHDWWTNATATKYKVKADRLAAQFDQYEPIPGVHIKGKLTLGENLADLGGIEAAYDAYRRYVVRHGEPPVIDGYTGDQRFFIFFFFFFTRSVVLCACSRLIFVLLNSSGNSRWTPQLRAIPVVGLPLIRTRPDRWRRSWKSRELFPLADRRPPPNRGRRR